MYRVLYQPELQQQLPKVDGDVYAALVYDGPRNRLRMLTGTLAHADDRRQQHADMFETAASMLNMPLSLSVQKERLRSIVAWWRGGAASRRSVAASLRPTPANFGADFGRMDIGLNPGWGRD